MSNNPKIWENHLKLKKKIFLSSGWLDKFDWMKFSGKVYLMKTLNVTKKRNFTLYLENNLRNTIGGGV